LNWFETGAAIFFARFTFQPEAVNDLDIPNFWDFHLWKIKRVKLAENWIWPICLFNQNNQRDFQPNQKYEIQNTLVSVAKKKTKNKRIIFNFTIFY